MAKPIITIIGLGLVGASMGLGLQKEEGDFDIVGHDREPDAAQAARKLGAVQRTEWNLHRACEGAELVVAAVPIGELDELLHQIAEDLKPGAMVFALTSLLQPAIRIASERLPSGIHFVAGHPIIAGVGGSASVRTDLFERTTFALAAGVHTDPGAVQLASDFVERVGAEPLFVDPQEHDGIIAAVEQLPQVIGAALMRMLSSGAGWRESRRLAGRQFAQTTALEQNAPELESALRTNRENLLFRIRQLQEELDLWHDLIAAEETPEIDQDDGGKEEDSSQETLSSVLATVVQARDRWEAQATLQNWEETSESAATAGAETPGMLRQMFFGNLMGGRRGERS